MESAESHGIGRSFVFGLIGALLFSVLLYILAHLLVPTPKITWRQFATVQPSGEVAFTNLDEIDWYIGIDEAEETLKEIRDRNGAIAEAQTRLRADLRRVSEGVEDKAAIGDIEARVRSGKFVEAFDQLSQVAAGLSADTQRQLNVTGTGDRLFDLDRMVRNQYTSLESLAPPATQLFFWTSPRLAVFEVLFWALFGVLTNLLVNSAEYLRKGQFVPRERFVAYTKLVYGPILATVMVLAIIFGFFDLGPYSSRVWTLPLVAFIFGYAARRTARLFDKLQDKVFGAGEASIAEGPQRILDAKRQALSRLRAAVRPKSLDELRDVAKKLAHEQIHLAAASVEAKS